MGNTKKKYMILSILSRHTGKERAIGMGELYVRVFGKRWDNRINDTTPLRKIITEMRREGQPIGSVRDRNGGGYYMATRSSHEFTEMTGRIEAEGLRKLQMVAAMKRMTLGELLGQMRLNLREGNSGDHRENC